MLESEVDPAEQRTSASDHFEKSASVLHLEQIRFPHHFTGFKQLINQPEYV
jgi:hypothetical protein